MDTGIEAEGETEREEGYMFWDMIMATHAYTKNPESPLGNEIDLRRWVALVFKGEHVASEHSWLVEYTNGIDDGYLRQDSRGRANRRYQERKREQVGLQRKHEWTGGRTKEEMFSGMIDGIKRKSRVSVGDSMVGKTDSRLSEGEDVVVYLPEARIEHVTERIEQVMGAGKGGSVLCSSHRDEQHGEGRYAGCSEEIPESSQEDEASHIWTDDFARNCTRDRRQERMIQ